MTDEKPPPPRTSRSANVNRPPEITARAGKKAPASAESRFIGYLVLGFGLLAVVAVIILALNSRNDEAAPEAALAVTGAPAATAPAKNSSEIARDLEKELRDRPVTVPVKEIERKDLYFKRQPDLPAAAIEGIWQSQIGDRTLVLKMSDGAYQLAISTTAQPNMRIYSAGSYRKIEDILTFVPQPWAPPSVPAGQTLYYKPLTRAEFPVIAAMERGKMLWQNPPPQERRVNAPSSLILVEPRDLPYVVWQKM